MLSKRKSNQAFTLIEIMVTLAIMVVITGLGITSMSGYLPKQRLISTAQLIETWLQRAQSEAYSRNTQVGIHFTLNATSGLTDMSVFIDANSNELQEAGEGSLTTTNFRTGILFGTTPAACVGVQWSDGATPGSCDFAATNNCYVMFNSSGQAMDPTSVANPLIIPTPVDYELIIYSSNLVSSATGAERNREIEALSSGLVAVIKAGQTGNAAGAKSALLCRQP